MVMVVDTSVIIAVLTDEASRPALIERTRNTELVAPSSVHWEVGNACSALLKRRRATIAQIRAMLASYIQIPLRFVDVDLVDALNLAQSHNLYAYDAYLLACALTLRAPLITLDHSLALAAEAAGVEVHEVTS